MPDLIRHSDFKCFFIPAYPARYGAFFYRKPTQLFAKRRTALLNDKIYVPNPARGWPQIP